MKIKELAQRKCELEMTLEGIQMAQRPSEIEKRVELEVMQIEARRELSTINAQISNYMEEK